MNQFDISTTWILKNAWNWIQDRRWNGKIKDETSKEVRNLGKRQFLTNSQSIGNAILCALKQDTEPSYSGVVKLNKEEADVPTFCGNSFEDKLLSVYRTRD